MNIDLNSKGIIRRSKYRDTLINSSSLNEPLSGGQSSKIVHHSYMVWNGHLARSEFRGLLISGYRRAESY